MTTAMRWMRAIAIAMIAAVAPAVVRAERFTPSITPASLPFIDGLSQSAMLLTRNSMPPGLTASSPTYVAPTAAQLADDHAAWVWIGPTAGTPLAFLVSRVAEIAVANLDWMQVSPPFFALRYFNGSVQVYEATGLTSGPEQYAAPYWLPGLYSEMTAGESHMCFLRTDQHVECKTTTAGFLAPTALMESRSAVAYTQITAASRFTCGLRALDQLVECFGTLGRDDSAPFAVNHTSTMHYLSIAAQFDSGFCGIVSGSGDFACFSVHTTESIVLPAPTAPLRFVYPLWLYMPSVLPFDQGCAMQSNGMLVCANFQQPNDLTLARPMSQATYVNTLVIGAAADTGLLQAPDQFTLGWISTPTVALFEVMRFIAVDPTHGSDANCAAVSLQSRLEVMGLIPCASLTRAVTLIAHTNTWIQPLPGTHSADSLTLSYSATTIASTHLLMPDELALLGNGSWLARMEETAGQAVTIDCAGALHCFSTMHSDIRFLGLTLTGSMEHAIVSSSDNSTDASSRLPPSTLAITNCVFDGMGAVLLKTKGSVAISGCTITNSLQSADTIVGLIELEDARLTMTRTNFSHNAFPVSDSFLRSCLRSVSSLPVTVSISDSHWLDNSASSEQVFSLIPGGVALQMRVNGPLVLTVTDSSFVQQDVRCRGCNGGAVSVLTGVGAAGNQIQVTFSRVQFDRNLNIMPDVEPDGREAVSELNYGSCLAVGDADADNHEALLTAADVTITGCSFRNSASMHGGCLSLGIFKSLLLTQSTFENCTGLTLNALASSLSWCPVLRVFLMLRFCSSSLASRLSWWQRVHGWSASHVPLGFTPPPLYELSHLTITGSRAWGLDGGVGGGIFLNSIGILLDINNVAFRDSQAIDNPDILSFGTGGGMQITSCSEVTLLSSQFTSTSADAGGAIAIDKTTKTTIQQTTFDSVYAGSRGGAISATNCDLLVQFSDFVDVGLVNQIRDPGGFKVVDRVGGAVAVSGGKARISRCSFTRVSALPNDLQLSSCAKFYDASSGFSSVGLGGAISAEYCEVDVTFVAAHDLRACSGGLLFARFSQATVAYGQSYSSARAHSGGVAVFVSCGLSQLYGTDSVQGVSAVAAGGAIVFNDCPQIIVDANRLSDVSVTDGDGGLIWIYAQRQPLLWFRDNVLASVIAPLGAGAVIFVQSAPNAFPSLSSINDSTLNNDFSGQPAVPSLYGPLIATGVSAVSAAQDSFSVSAGSLLSTSSSPLRITALDSYQQRILQDRGLVVQVSCPEVEFRGTTLRRIDATDGSALFSDLRIIAAPGNYTLSFSIVSAPAVSIALNLTVTADCPAASFYSSLDRSCVECASDILVYNATANACERCPAGWQRVSANDTTGALRDGVSCELCPLGQVSTVGSLCAECGPNTYQPIPLSECVACSAVDGLNCVGDGLARVESGFFAMAIGEGTEQRIHTYQCPESFCSAAQAQVATATGNSSSLLSSSAVNSFSQCAFPRLASPTNLLCGECAAGYRPWGNKCSKCDSANGGLLLLLIVLSFALCAWLLRAAMVTSAAGHSVIILYFVQTVMLELGTINRLLSWLNFTLFSPNSTTDCIAPLSPYQQVQAQVLMPVVLEIELICIGLMHWAAFKRWGTLATSEPTPSAKAPLSVRARHAVLRFVSQFSVDVYVNATLSLMLFSYTQVCAACVNYLQCVDVGDASVVFNQPAMRCGSADYAHTRGLVLATLILYVAGFPAAIALFLIVKRRQLRDAYAWIDQRLAAEAADDLPPSNLTPAARFVSRYAPLFAMYSPSTSFWQLFVVSRRICFVTIAVMLVRDPQQKFMAFVLAHVVSQLAQLIAQPFRLRLLNAADFVAHLLLIVISATLSAHPSPDTSVDLFVFFLVVPPLAAYSLVVLWQHRREKKAAHASAVTAASTAAKRQRGGVELGTWSSKPASDSNGQAVAKPKPTTLTPAAPSSKAAAGVSRPPASAAAPASSPTSAGAIASPSTSGSGSSLSAAAVDPTDVQLTLPLPRPLPATQSSSPPPPLTRTFSVLSGPRRVPLQSAAVGSPSSPSQRGVLARGQSRRQQLAGLLKSAQDSALSPSQSSAADPTVRVHL